MHDTFRINRATRQFAAVLALATLSLTLVASARAMELIPSLGMTKSTDANAGDAQGFAGLALRAPLSPFFKLEGGLAYRQDTYANGDIKVSQWPVTASLWATPFPSVYAGAGLGWYHTTLSFPHSALLGDATSSRLGVHLGGGVTMPISPKLGLDLNGRYVFMSKDNDVNIPTTFNPDFWTVTAGLAVSF